MPQMSSTDATYHAAHDIIYALHNTEPEIPLVKLGHGNKEEMNTLADISIKETPPAVPPRVLAREVGQRKLQETNQKGTQMKSTPQ